MTGSPAREHPACQVLVTSRSFSSGDLDLAGELRAAGCRVVVGQADHDVAALRPLLARTSAWIAGAAPITAAHLDAAPKLRLVARYGVGVDAVDLAAASARGIQVTNTPGANTGAVADHAVALMLASLRDLTRGDRDVRAGVWTVRRTRELASLTVGLAGLGRVGRAVADRLRAFGCRVIGHDPWVPADELAAIGIVAVDLPTLARDSDIVSLHAPGGGRVVDDAFVALARPGLILVNTARAALVDESSIARALREDRLRCYATDVLSGELGDSENPLLAADLTDRTIFTPHSAAQTVEAVDGMGRGAVDAVLACLRGDDPPNLVSTPGGHP